MDPLRVSTTDNPYGLRIFDRPMEYLEEEQEEDEYGENSCPNGCCDNDCECDDCLRCSNNGLVEPEISPVEYSAAAA